MTALLLMLSTASAGELALSFPAEPVRYHGELLVDSGEAIWMLGRNNLNARAKTITAAADFTCRGEESGRGWELDCVVDQIALEAVPFSEPERERVDAIMAEYVELMTFEHVQLSFGGDGHIRTVDVEGVDKNDERAREVHEMLRLLMRRMFVPFEQQVPRKGTAEVGQKWKHKGNVAALEVFSKYGTIGGTLMKYTVAADAGSTVVLTSEGRGTIGASNAGAVAVTGGGSVSGTDQAGNSTSVSETSNQSGISATGSLYSATGTGEAHFDSSLGWWSYAQSVVEADRNQSTPPIRFTHAAWLGRINPDGSVTRPAPTEE